MPLKSSIPAIRAGLRDATARGVRRAAGHVADLARQLAPIDTGALRRSIRVEDGTTDTQVAVTAGRGLADIRAIAQEFGTVYQPAQPYMTPAARAIKPEIEVAAELQALYQRSDL